MFFSRPIQWYHSYADPIRPDGTFKKNKEKHCLNYKNIPPPTLS